MRTTKDDRAWLSRNWTPSDASFRSWVAGSTRAHSIVSHLIADVDDAERLLGNVVEAAELVRGNPQIEDLWNELMEDDGHIVEAAAFLKEPKQ